VAGSAVTVRDGLAVLAVLADGSSLAGSTITVADAVRRLLDAGIDLPEIVAASAGRAARLLGAPAPLSVGAPADLVVLDPERGSVRTLPTAVVA